MFKYWHTLIYHCKDNLYIEHRNKINSQIHEIKTQDEYNFYFHSNDSRRSKYYVYVISWNIVSNERTEY